MAVESIDKPNMDQWISHQGYKTTLLASYVGKHENPVNFTRRKATFDTCVGRIGAMIALDGFGNKEIYFSMTGARNTQPGLGRSDHTGRNGCKICEAWSPEVFVRISRTEAICLLDCPTSQTYVHDLVTDQQKLEELLRLEMGYW